MGMLVNVDFELTEPLQLSQGGTGADASLWTEFSIPMRGGSSNPGFIPGVVNATGWCVVGSALPATPLGSDNVVMGTHTHVGESTSTTVTVGANAEVSPIGMASAVDNVVVGADASAIGSSKVVIGAGATASHNLSGAIGPRIGKTVTQSTGSDRMTFGYKELEVEQPGQTGASFLILRSPNGSKWRVGVSNAGVVSAAAIGLEA